MVSYTKNQNVKKSISLPAENIKTWNGRDFEDSSAFELECHSCSSFCRFEVFAAKPIWMWDIDIPIDWKYGQWERVRLYPASVRTYTVKCPVCDAKYRAYPSFIVRGTTLTLAVLIFIAFVYEYSDLTWRDIPEKFCTGEDRIAHSTLYKAVHGLGASLAAQGESLASWLLKLLATSKTLSPETLALKHKSCFPHTKLREKALHKLMVFLSPMSEEFLRAFYAFIHKLQRTISSLDPPVTNIYI